MKTNLALGREAAHPTMRALTRDPHRFRDMRDRHALLDPFDQQSTAMDCETSITVRHEDLRAGVKRANSTPLGGLHPVNASPTSRPSTASWLDSLTKLPKDVLEDFDSHAR